MKPNEILKLLKTCDELCISELIEDLQNHLIVEKNKWIQQNLAHVYEFSSQHQLSFGMLHDNCKDMIFGKNVDARYVEELTNPFEDLEFEGTDKEKEEQQNQ